uniref:Cytochrome c oxidase subunit 2 n=12 Tax=Atta TaxID=12956 RepID=V9MH63_9HYME|nr:cytochrome c oxidase subunit II [Atta laevigata]ASY95846.1 cytochrome c oxidase subunit II [Atta opaciceps]
MNTWLISLQDSNSPTYDLMIFFHDFAMIILTYITILILFITFSLMSNKFINRFLLENQTIEIVWTILPMFILIAMAIPSIKVLYLTDEIFNVNLTVKALGHQWYWSYEFSDFSNIDFDSFMIPTNQLMNNEFRLLDVDNRCILPYKYPIRILTTSMDVIHSWAIPALGIKMDSIPGRLNQSLLFMNRPGLFFGQCSEICGTNHSFMPIAIESTNLINFKNWIFQFYQ